MTQEERKALAEEAKRLFDEAWDALIDVAVPREVKTTFAGMLMVAGKRKAAKDAIDRLASAAPAAQATGEMTERDQFDFVRWHKRLGELADEYYATGPTHPARERARASLLYHALDCATGWRVRSAVAAAAAPAAPVQPRSADGSLTLDEALAGVQALFPGADKQALRCLGELLTKPAAPVQLEPVALLPPINYATLYTYADTARIDYNELCSAVRSALGVPDDAAHPSPVQLEQPTQYGDKSRLSHDPLPGGSE